MAFEKDREDIIEGRNAVIEALRAGRGIDKLYLAKGETDKTLGHIEAKARDAGVPVVRADRRKLDAMSVTGRKIIVDTYGGYACHGGGAFSGKDPTKVDRSAAYMARYIAKNIVAAGLARRCEIELAYAIGVAKPVSVLVDTEGTGALPEAKLEEIVNQAIDLRPAKIIERLDLRRPIYRQTAAYGHFGRTDVDLPWEQLDAADALKQYL